MKLARGFTILELLVTLAVVGVLYTILAPLTDATYRLSKSSYRNEQLATNRAIAGAMLDWMDQRSQTTLPAPYTGTGFQDVVVDVSSTDANAVALLALMTSQGIPALQTYATGAGPNKARVYQRVAGLTTNVPLYGLAGPSVALQYDIGVLYVSDCRRDDTSCYPSASGVAGYSPKFETGNFSTWEPAEGDDAAYRFSTLPLQQARLAATRQRIDRLRDSLRDYFSSRFLSGSPDPNINYFPAPSGGGAPALGGATPSVNDGCRDGWYDLSAANVNVLGTLGLLKEEFSRTAWAGAIEYCRDFDPAGSSPEGEAPQNAAIRINRAATQGSAPGAAGTNLIFTI